MVIATSFLAAGEIEKSSPCVYECRSAEVVSLYDLYGLEIESSPNGQWIYVLAPGRPGLPGMNYGAIEVFEIMPDGSLRYDSLAMIDEPVHDSAFGQPFVAFDDMIVAGAYRTTVNGVPGAGQVHVLSRTVDGWESQSLSEGSDCSYVYLGSSVGASETMIVACEHQCDKVAPRRARVFERVDQEWQPAGFIHPPESPECVTCYGSFGTSIVVGSDYIALGTPNNEAPGGPASGRVHVYAIKGEPGNRSWELTQELLPDEIEPWAEFGWEMMLIDDSTMVVFAGYNLIGLAGRVYIFERGADQQWTQLAMHELEVFDPGSYANFPADVSLSPDGQRLAMVASADGTPFGEEIGLAYVLDLTSGEQQAIRPYDRQTLDELNKVTGIEFITDTRLLISEPLATVDGLPRAGRLFDVDLGTYRNCHHDLSFNGEVDNADVLTLFGYWGTAHADADLDCDGTVGFEDLLRVLAHWGSCPFAP